MPSFKIRGLPALEKKNEGFLIRYGQGGYPRPVTWAIDISFLSHCQRKLHMKFGFDWPSGFREKCLK